MSAHVSAMRPMLIAPACASTPGQQSACRSIVGTLAGHSMNRPWAFDATGKTGVTTTTSRHLGSGST